MFFYYRYLDVYGAWLNDFINLLQWKAELYFLNEVDPNQKPDTDKTSALINDNKFTISLTA